MSEPRATRFKRKRIKYSDVGLSSSSDDEGPLPFTNLAGLRSTGAVPSRGGQSPPSTYPNLASTGDVQSGEDVQAVPSTYPNFASTGDVPTRENGQTGASIADPQSLPNLPINPSLAVRPRWPQISKDDQRITQSVNDTQSTAPSEGRSTHHSEAEEEESEDSNQWPEQSITNVDYTQSVHSYAGSNHSENGGGDEEDVEGDDDSAEDIPEDDLDRWSVLDATAYLYSEKVKHCISDNAFRAIWVALKRVLPILSSVPTEYLPSAQTIKRHALQDIPEMSLEVAHQNIETGEEVIEYNLNQFPKKKYEDRDMWEPVYEVWRADLSGVLRHHIALHGGRQATDVVINVDGVPIGRTGKSQTIVSLQFANCRNVYQLVNAIPTQIGKKHITVPLLLRSVCDDLRRLQLNLKYISADAPMRSFLRKQKSHAGRKACDYCYGEAGHVKKPIWSVRTLHAEERTYEQLLRDYDEHDRTGRPLEEFGYKGKSELVELLPGFDIIENIPVDSMHLFYLGITRNLFELLFKVGETRETNKRDVPRCSLNGLNRSLPQIKVPKEVGRRPRTVDFKNYKASEWRNLILYYFPVTLPEITKGLRRQLWLEFCYLARAYSLDDESFLALNKEDLQKLALKWYRNFNNEFGSNNMRYSIHLIAHLLRLRVHGPVCETSAFAFEGSFAASSRAQQPGTTSIGLQSMRQSYIRPREGHTCKKKLSFRNKVTMRSNDTLIYTVDEKYEIVEVGDDNISVKEIVVTTYFPPVKTKLDFTSVGVWKYVYTKDEVKIISKSSVKGKLIAVQCEDYTVLLSATISMLLEAD